MATGFVFHELYMWHNTWNWAQVFAPSLTIQPGEHAENPETKRRFRNLLEVSGLLDHLVAIKAQPASEDALARAHTRAHIARIKAMSAENGGDASTLTPFGKGSFEIAQLAAGGTMAAFDINRGGRVWTIAIGSNQTPWVAGDFIYVLTTDSEVVCLTRDDGRVRWIQGLPRYRNEEDREGVLQWSGPVLVGDRLIVTGSSGEALSLSPYTGELLGRMVLRSKTFVPPVVANNTVYILSDDAVLTALR